VRGGRSTLEALATAMLPVIRLRVKTTGSERKMGGCSEAKAKVLNGAEVERSETSKWLSKSSRDLSMSPLTMIFGMCGGTGILVNAAIKGSKW